MMRRTVGLVLWLLVLVPATAQPAAVTTKEVEEALTCQCGCGLTVHSCNHLSCPSAIPLKREIAAVVAEGLGSDEIRLRFREKYGEKILAAPTTEGFNLAAWILPFAVVFAGALLVIIVVRRWAAQGETADSRSERASLTREDRQRIETELRRDDV